MNSDDCLKLLQETSAILTNSHFVGTSGAHLDTYFDKRVLFAHTSKTRSVCTNMAKPYQGDGVEVVAAPALGGIVLSQHIAHILTTEFDAANEVYAVYAERHDYALVLPSCYAKLLNGKRILIAEDTITTGHSVRQVIQTVRDAHGLVVGVTCICNNDNVTAESLAVPRLESLTQFTVKTYPVGQSCKLCRAGIPIDESVGHGAEYVRQYGQPKRSS